MTTPDHPVSPENPSGQPSFEPQMSELEALMWTLEDRDPRLRSTMLMVVLFEPGLGFDQLAGRVRRLIRVLPRFAERVVPSLVPGVPPRWEPDPAFDQGYHLRRVAAPTPGDFDTVLDMAEPMASEGFDKARPPWQMVFVGGLDFGQSALIVKLHHSITDGVGATRLATILFDLSEDVAPPATGEEISPPTSPVAPSSSALDRLIGDVTLEVTRGVSFVRQAVPVVAAGWRELGAALANQASLWDGSAEAEPPAEQPAPAAEQPAPAGAPSPGFPAGRASLELLASALRLVAPASAPLSPIMSGRSLGSRLAVIEVPLEDARRAAKASGGTINDVYVAAVTEGLQRYHRHHDCEIEAIRIGVPINIRRDETVDALGNQVTAARIVAPFGTGGPAERIPAIHLLLAAARAEPALGLVGPLAGIANRLRPLHGLVRSTIGGVDAVASNVPGSPVPLYLEGIALAGVIGFGPRAGAAINLTMVSYAGALRVGINVDPVAVPDVDVLVDCLRYGFSETVGAPA